jgi:predicted ATP-grasp superfamily ATP-dependent carboligase
MLNPAKNILLRGQALGAAQCPAIVVGGNLNALGVVRSLARGGVPIHLIARAHDDIAAWSRYCTTHVAGAFDERSLVECLTSVCSQLNDKAFLIVTDEEAVRTVARNKRILSAMLRFDIPDASITDTLENKIGFYELAKREGFPLPHTVPIQNFTDISKLRVIDGPVIVKPADKTAVRGCPEERAMLARNRRDAEKRCHFLVGCGANAVAQEWIEGADSDLYFCLFYANSCGEPLAVFTGRKLSSYPEDVGSTAVCGPAPEAAPILDPIARRFAKLTGMAGAGGVEFKWDRRNRRFVIVEPTVGRTDWQAEVATFSGINIPLIGYRHATGESAPESLSGDRPIIWRSSGAHRVSGLDAQTRVIDGYWRAADPGPAWAYYVRSRARKLSPVAATSLFNIMSRRAAAFVATV